MSSSGRDVYIAAVFAAAIKMHTAVCSEELNFKQQ